MDTNTKRTLIPMFILFCTAFILRLGYLLFLKSNYFFWEHPSSDVQYYLEWALDIARGNWMGKGAFWGLPLYPYSLALILRLTALQTFPVQLAQIALGSLNCGLVFILGRQLFSERVARLSGLLCALNFSLIYYDCLLLPVTLLVFWGLVIIITALNIQKPGTPLRQWFLWGMLSGLATLGDGKFFIFTILFLCRQSYRHRANFKAVARPLLVSVLGFALVVGGIFLRNTLASGSPVLISAQSGLSFYVGNNPKADGSYEHPTFMRPDHAGQDIDQQTIAQIQTDRPMTAAEISRFWFNKGVDFIRSSPEQYGRLLIQKLHLFLLDDQKLYDIDMLLQHEWKQSLDINPYWLTCPFAVLGIILTCLRKRPVTELLLFLGSQLVLSLLFFVTYRHRATIMPILIIFQAFALVWFVDAIRQKHWKDVWIGFLFVCLFVFLFPQKSLPAQEHQFLQYSKTAPILEQKGQYAPAEDHYKKALSIHPLDPNNLYNYGSLLIRQGKLPQAISVLNRALAINPFDPNTHFNLAYAYQDSEQWEKAERHYQKVLTLSPGSLDARWQLAVLYQETGNCPAAVPHIRTLTTHFPSQMDFFRETFRACWDLLPAETTK